MVVKPKEVTKIILEAIIQGWKPRESGLTYVFDWDNTNLTAGKLLPIH